MTGRGHGSVHEPSIPPASDEMRAPGRIRILARPADGDTGSRDLALEELERALTERRS